MLCIHSGESAVNNAVSLDTAAVVTDTSKRTLWRRVSDGSIARCGTDERGRTLLALDDLEGKLSVPFQLGGLKMIIRC